MFDDKLIAILTTLPDPVLASAGFVLGLVFGSFANVCISRLPKKESVIFPASHCTSCNAPIRAMDNITILSYVILKGQCRACKGTGLLCWPGKVQ